MGFLCVWLCVAVCLTCGPRQLFFLQCGRETPKGWTTLPKVTDHSFSTCDQWEGITMQRGERGRLGSKVRKQRLWCPWQGTLAHLRPVPSSGPLSIGSWARNDSYKSSTLQMPKPYPNTRNFRISQPSSACPSNTKFFSARTRGWVSAHTIRGTGWNLLTAGPPPSAYRKVLEAAPGMCL